MQPQNQPQMPPPDQSGYLATPTQRPADPNQQMVYAQPQMPQDPTMSYAPTPQSVPGYGPQLTQQSVPGYYTQQGSPIPAQRPADPNQQMVYAQPQMPQVAPAVVPDAAMQATSKQAATAPAPRPKNTTQNSLLFSEIRDNMLIMADGSFRAVIACKSINFDLMSSREREGVEFSYQNFINSLTHPVQILIRSQKVDIGPYLERLVKIRKTQDNMLLGVLMDDYIDFIEILSEEANIMHKSFYLIVPYAPTGDLSNIKDAGKGFFTKMFGGGGGPAVTKIDKITYQKAKDEMKNRVDSVSSGLFSMGVHCKQLTSKQLASLYYSYYNPDTAIRQPLENFEENTFTYVQKGDGQADRPNITGGIV